MTRETQKSNINNSNKHPANRIPELDGVRGLAVLAVMCTHTAFRFAPFHLQWVAQRLWIGVDLFFVLSGFLITGILLDSRRSRNYFRNFYARRALRIWPLYYALLLFAFGVFPFLVAKSQYLSTHLPHDGRSVWDYIFYIQNLRYSPMHPLLGVTWSLAIEEQFYLVWPLVVRIASPRTLRRLVLMVLIFSPILRTVCAHLGMSPHAVYMASFCRLDGLAAGALLALSIRSDSIPTSIVKKVSMAVVIIGAACAFAIIPADVTDPVPSLAYSILAITFAGLVAWALTAAQEGSRSAFSMMLRWSPLQYCGKISYCLYLVHLPVFMLLNSHILRRGSGLIDNSWHGNLLALILGFGISLSVASVSWFAFERPILQLKSKLAERHYGPLRHSGREMIAQTD